MSPWLVINDTSTYWCWPLAGEATDDLVNAGRILAGVPADEAWVGAHGWDVAITSGRPDRLPEHVVVVLGAHDELTGVEGDRLDDYGAARVNWARAQRIETAAAVLEQLDDDDLTVVLSRR